MRITSHPRALLTLSRYWEAVDLHYCTCYVGVLSSADLPQGLRATTSGTTPTRSRPKTALSSSRSLRSRSTTSASGVACSRYVTALRGRQKLT